MGRAGRIALVTLTAVALILACGGLLAGCRAKLPADFSRMQDAPDQRGGGDPPALPEANAPLGFSPAGEDGTEYSDFRVSASYERVDKLLVITVDSIYEIDTLIGITEVPDWIEIPAGREFTIAGGSGTTGMTIELMPGEENDCWLRIGASAAEGLHYSETTVYIQRPLYFSNAEFDPYWGELAARLVASDRQTGKIECQLPADISTTAETQLEFSGAQNFCLPLSFDNDEFSIGESRMTASDQFGNSAEASVAIYVWPPKYAPDTLYAYPLSNYASAYDSVTVVVATGPTAHPFQYMNGVGVTVDCGATYEVGTLNVGAPGGDQRDPDGIWALMNPLPDLFLLPTDFMIQEYDIGMGRLRIDCNVTPVGGSEVTDGGEIFNFCLVFESAGRYTLGFEEFRDVKRTYYMDSKAKEHNWGDISNDHPEVPNMIVVH